MWESIVGRFPTGLILICAILSFLIPLIFYQINHKLRTHGDPPWKKKTQKKKSKGK